MLTRVRVEDVDRQDIPHAVMFGVTRHTKAKPDIDAWIASDEPTGIFAQDLREKPSYLIIYRFSDATTAAAAKLRFA